MQNKNQSEWRVSTNPVAGKTFYGVYRIRDLDAPDHSGNRETRGYYETRWEAEKLARLLNEEEAKK